ncbi:MAG: DUF1778 domain-containing protein [Alphaproteobacteria bacterium]|nr:MAG: DUF1778 domain-containing protein [Alphaproteobacteria bacterium]TAF39144.1 MAG: DUF1778 domain-containing protein [Alphaproteobacteria bacterium]TAF77461.1 MAG: DUF1778 domain-containing protein [Alphaproteobacteria bacterium]
MLSHGAAKDALINMRIHSGMRDFIDRAAQVSGKDRSDFMLEAAYEKAEEVLLNRTTFILSDEQWDAFNALLDNPPQPNDKLRTLLATPAPWE